MDSKRQSGFTIIELIVVVAILGIILAIATPSFQQMIANQRISSTTSTLQSALMLARSEALKRNANVSFAPTTPNQWESGWNTTLTDGTVLSTYAAIATVSISSTASSIVFQGSGRVSGGSVRSFQVSAANTSLIKCVAIDLTGLPTVTTSAC